MKKQEQIGQIVNYQVMSDSVTSELSYSLRMLNEYEDKVKIDSKLSTRDKVKSNRYLQSARASIKSARFGQTEPAGTVLNLLEKVSKLSPAAFDNDSMLDGLRNRLFTSYAIVSNRLDDGHWTVSDIPMPMSAPDFIYQNTQVSAFNKSFNYATGQLDYTPNKGLITRMERDAKGNRIKRQIGNYSRFDRPIGDSRLEDNIGGLIRKFEAHHWSDFDKPILRHIPDFVGPRKRETCRTMIEVKPIEPVSYKAVPLTVVREAEPVAVRPANWTWDDGQPSRCTEEHIRELLDQPTIEADTSSINRQASKRLVDNDNARSFCWIV